jgi:hypothetical protein
MVTHFAKLNTDWNAEPNAPDPRVTAEAGEVVLEFTANPFQFPRFAEGQVLRLRFKGATRYRLGPTNDEGWTRGQCRFSGEAPAWGDFYEVSGDLRLDRCPQDWVAVSNTPGPARRHFLFYLRDQTFECTAADWRLDITEARRP